MNRVRSHAGVRFLAFLILSLGLSGCSTVSNDLAGISPQTRARMIDSQLAAADWNVVKPRTAQQARYLRSLAPLLIHYRIGSDGHLHFWMADPYNCHCLFYGGQAAYIRYRIIQRKEKWTAREERDSAAYAATKWHRTACRVPPYRGGGFPCL
jgi:hypothetical protein